MVARTQFGSLTDVIDLPDLIEIQTTSYRDFLQMDVPVNKRKLVGLQAVFKEVFPIESYDGQCSLDFVKYEVTEPKMSAIDAIKEGSSYSAPLYVTFRLRDGKEVREERAVIFRRIPASAYPGRC